MTSMVADEYKEGYFLLFLSIVRSSLFHSYSPILSPFAILATHVAVSPANRMMLRER